MTPYTNNMFQSIKNALAKNENSNSAKYKELLKLEIGNTYMVRLLPVVKSPQDTFLHYFTFGWQSFATGQNILITSPTSWNERDPIGEERYRVYRHGNPEEKKKMEAIRRNENWLVNAYVISDPVHPENNGKIKAIKYGRQLNKVIDGAINGEESAELGSKIFDLSKDGCSLKIKVEKQGEYPTYVSSKFQFPKEIEGLNPADYEKIYNSVHDLKSFVTVKSYDELKLLLDQHFFCKEAAEAAPKTETAPKASPKAANNSPVETAPQVADMNSDEIQNLLKELETN